MDEPRFDSIIEENRKRLTVLYSFYNPINGIGSPIERVPVHFTINNKIIHYNVPKRMYDDLPKFINSLNRCGSLEELLIETNIPVSPQSIASFIAGIANIRFLYDLEFWTCTCVKIQDKETKRTIPFILNRAQRRLLARLEKMRNAGIPIRVILLKARQWGGSTLIQVYMAWLQIILKLNWHSVIVADVEEQAKNIRGMYSRLAREYPQSISKVKLVPYERSTKSRIVEGRNCVISIGSAQKPDNLRSFDLCMAHFSEAGFYKATAQKSPEDLVQSIRAAVSDVPDSLIALESTAKGVGNFFHREWQAAKEGRNSYDPVFVPWYEIERYQLKIKDYSKFITWMLQPDNSYAQFLWAQGATLEGINWYFDYKRREGYDDWRMQSEFPTTDLEAFISTGQRVFAPDYVNRARKNCVPPEFIGDITSRSQKGKDAFENIEFIINNRGLLLVWNFPDKEENISDRYAVVVDIGGRTHDADYSVIRVFDRYWQMDGGKPEVVATWRGHRDQDLIAWKAAQIAKIYNDALLIIESNSLDKDELEGSEGAHFLTVLDEIVKYYSNMYARTTPDKIRQGIPIKYGFHTDKSTKPMIIDELNGALREESYIERDLRACDEMDTYEIKPNGSYGAVEGTNDDLVIVTAIGVWACFKYMPTPHLVTKKRTDIGKRIISEATI